MLGPVDEATKWSLLRHAEALVSPSPYESFSLVLMEAWQAGTPVLGIGGLVLPSIQMLAASGATGLAGRHRAVGTLAVMTNAAPHPAPPTPRGLRDR